MSVIITGMDTPYGCAECGGCYDYREDKYFCALHNDSFDIDIDKDKPKRCPIKSIDGLIEKMEFFAKRQEEIALAINDEDERYAHIQVANAYHHCVQVIKEYCEVEDADSN